MHGLQTIKRLNDAEQAIVAEALRQAEINPISDRLDKAYQEYIAERDQAQTA